MDFNLHLNSCRNSSSAVVVSCNVSSSRTWIDYEFWYDRKTQMMKYVKVDDSHPMTYNEIRSYFIFESKDMYLLTAMGLPGGGGRQHISQRFQSRFNLINMIFPLVDKNDTFRLLSLSMQ
jgi:hypothetical protein